MPAQPEDPSPGGDAILRQIADDCEQALDELSLEQADERPVVIDAHIALLESRLGMAAFSSLDSYIYRTFEGDADDSGSSTPPPPSTQDRPAAGVPVAPVEGLSIRPSTFPISPILLSARRTSG